MAPTPTSQTDARFEGDSGVTLLEMMAAVLVVSLLAAMVLFAAPGPERQMRAFVERFAAHVARGGEESVVVNKAVALILDDTGYRFLRREDGVWIEAPVTGPLARRPWPEGVRVVVPSQQSEKAPVTTFDVLGGAQPAEIRLSKAGLEWRVAVSAEGSVHVARLQ